MSNFKTLASSRLKLYRLRNTLRYFLKTPVKDSVRKEAISKSQWATVTPDQSITFIPDEENPIFPL